MAFDSAGNWLVGYRYGQIDLSICDPSEETIQRHISLSNQIVPNESSYSVSSFKIEIKLKKSSATRWNQLEGEQKTEPDCSAYPSSSKNPHDWDKLEKEAAQLEDDSDPLDRLFKNIYADASDETRRAMMKSFVESNGTVLSTNWDEVGKGKVEMRPPDGLEFKKYNT